MKIEMFDEYEQRDNLLATRNKYLQQKKQEQSADNKESQVKEPPVKPYEGNLINNYASSLTGSASHSNVIALDDYITKSKTIKENKKSYEILKKMPVENLPKTEYLDLRSHVGEFISDADLDKVYEDDFSDCLHKMTDTSILCFTCVDGSQTWWSPKTKNGEIIGMVRTK